MKKSKYIFTNGLIDLAQSRLGSKVVFKTGQFDDIQVGRDGNTLILSIIERPSIASIELDGNKAIKTERIEKPRNKYALLLLKPQFSKTLKIDITAIIQ